MTKILLIRHATTDAVGKKLSGRNPGVFLNSEGEKQAQQLRQRLAGVHIDAIYSSPLERALETAEPLATSRQLQTEIWPDFLEINFGEWTNKAFSDLQNEKTFQLFNSFRSATRIPGGEMMAEAQIRIINGLQKLSILHPQGTVAVVSHSDLIKAAIAYYAGIHLDMFQRIEIDPASVSIIALYPETPKILVINDTGGINLAN